MVEHAVAMQVETADGVRLWWERAGDGPVVLLVPGSGDCSDIFPGSFTQRLVDGGCSVLRFDQRDTGRSDDGGDTYTLRTMAADTIAVLDAAGVERAHLVGMLDGGHAHGRRRVDARPNGSPPSRSCRR